MYLAGMDIYDIMKITGHSTPMMLNKYIKADQLEVWRRLPTNMTILTSRYGIIC